MVWCANVGVLEYTWLYHESVTLRGANYTRLYSMNSQLQARVERDRLESERKKRAELTTLEARNAELLEAVKKAHEILLHEMDNGRTPSMLQGVGLGYFEDVISGVKS